MDNKVTVRFYQVQRHHDTDLGFSQVLAHIRALSQTFPADYLELDEDVWVRLERYEADRQYVRGEFTRKQTVNLPPKVVRGDLEASTDPIAHRVAFQYNIALGILAIEQSRSGMTLPRVNKYIIDLTGHAGFEFVPVITSNAMEQLTNGTPKKLVLKVAHPEHLNIANASASARGIAQQLRSMKDLFGGPVIEANIGFGRGQGSLHKQNVLSVIRFMLANEDQVEKIQVKIDGEQEPIDLLTQQLKGKRTLRLNDDDLDAHYQTRRSYIEHLFRGYLRFLQTTYGAAA